MFTDHGVSTLLYIYVCLVSVLILFYTKPSDRPKCTILYNEHVTMNPIVVNLQPRIDYTVDMMSRNIHVQISERSLSLTFVDWCAEKINRI